MTALRFRLKFMFWLDVRKEDEFAIAEIIEDLKEKRSYTKTIRDGIRLICDLQKGKLDVLFELFPWVRAEFMEYIQSLQPLKTPAELDLQSQLERLEQLLIKQGNKPIDTSQAAPIKLLTHNGGPKPLQTKTLTVPAFDDDDGDLLVIRKDHNAGHQSSINFIKSAFALNGMTYDESQP